MKKAILILLLLPIIASSQLFRVFDIDTSDYPIMKAKFYSIDENGDQILNHTKSDFEITENGNPAEVLSVSCSNNVPDPVSFVVAVDVSGSMSGSELNILKSSLKYFIDLIPNNGSEVSIIAFNNKNHFISDFTSNKSKLKSRVDALSAGGGTDFDAAFINPVAGALLAMEEAKFLNRNVIIITDGKASGDENVIINKAKALSTRIFGMLIKNKPPKILQNIFNKTKGKSFENIITEDEFKEHFLNIKKLAVNDPCEIVWTSNISCNNLLNIMIRNNVIDLKSYKELSLNESVYQHLELDKYYVNFGTISTDTIITVTAKNGNQIINDIIFEPDNGDYKIATPLPVTIPRNGSVEIELKYTAANDSKEYARMNIIGDYCNTSLGLLKGDKNKPLAKKTLELTHPNGGEFFLAGSDTIMNWKGISNKEKVMLEFSSDIGKNWSKISDTTIGLNQNWIVPNIKSENCLIKVSSFPSKNNLPLKNPGDLIWEKSLGGGWEEYISSIIDTENDSYIAVGMFESYDKFIDRADYQKDLWIVKMDNEGEIIWDSKIHKRSMDFATSIKKFDNNKYVILGTSELSGQSSSNIETIWVCIINKDGNIEMNNLYGNKGYAEANDIEVTKDGGFIITGMQQLNINNKLNNDCFVIKVDEYGDQEWIKYYGGSKNDYGNSITQTADGNYIVVGSSLSSDGDIIENIGLYDIFVLKINKIGTVLWSKTLGGSQDDNAKTVISTSDGGFIIAGYTRSNDNGINKNNSGYACLVFKFDKNGNLEWTNTYGGNRNDYGNSIKQTNDGGFIMTGHSESDEGEVYKNKGEEDFWIMKLQIDGSIDWSESYGGSLSDKSVDIIETSDNNFLAVGTTHSIDGDIKNGIEGSNGWVVKIAGRTPPLQSDTSDAVFSIIIPEPVIQNNDIDMGEMIVGNTKDTIVSSVICNTGDAPLHVLGVDITGGDDIDFLITRGAGDFYLEKDECQDMMFEFTPSQLGNRTAVATIRTTIGDFTDTLNIRGVGIDPSIEATTEVVDFGQFELGDGKDTTLFLVKNVGSKDITITDTRISGPDMEQFTLSTVPISYTIPAGKEKEIKLNYTAKLGGKSNSFLDFHYDGVGSPLRSMLFAEGIGGEVYPQVPDAYVGERVELGLHLGRIKPEGLDEVATNFTATVSYNSTLLAPIDKNMTVTTKNTTSFIDIEGQLSGAAQIATVPMKVGLGTAVSSGLVVTEFQLYNANGDSVDYEIEPGVGEFNVLGICEEGGTRLVNPNGEQVGLKVAQDQMNTNATVSLNLIESGQTDLIIYDQLGNAIETAYSGIPSTGTKVINIDLSNFANGRYYIKLTTPTITKTEIIEVVR